MYCTNNGAKIATICPVPLAIPHKPEAYLGDKSTELIKCPEEAAPANKLEPIYIQITKFGFSIKDSDRSKVIRVY